MQEQRGLFQDKGCIFGTVKSLLGSKGGLACNSANAAAIVQTRLGLANSKPPTGQELVLQWHQWRRCI